ncbi:polysaccharide export protein EpsE [Telluria mixta]|uniref:Polysaccharide export protein EpsE n=1 Tax=Telluria mixta TaxID=34071 RepID=A0ABT2BZI9_9BURK|nr:polysaccharide export protein EpsE [Telluria mixta]MCS0630545.1 polysaccharide export protein EpsE [Telluria mixta]WEM94151.1 polysaccharide export protein EpsE [Telluria mixta]
MKRFVTRVCAWTITAVLALGVDMAHAADVVLGAGDMVKVSVYGSPDLATEARVSEAGSMTFPLLGDVQVGGLTAQEAEKKLGGLLEKGGFLRKAQVNLLITTLASQQVSVLGQVNRPGRYPVDGPRKVLDLLALAGGMGPEGGDMVSLVRTRNGATTRETIDVVDMVRKGELNRDYEVAGGDIIFVERAPRAYITGEVQRPGPFRLERAMTIRQALSAGGGLTQRGTQHGLRITRRDANGGAQTIDAKPDDLVQVDDVITVKESWF